MANQLDWVQREAQKMVRLQELENVIERAITLNMPYSQPAIRTTLMMIKRHYGVESEEAAIKKFKLMEK